MFKKTLFLTHTHTYMDYLGIASLCESAHPSFNIMIFSKTACHQNYLFHYVLRYNHLGDFKLYHPCGADLGIGV